MQAFEPAIAPLPPTSAAGGAAPSPQDTPWAAGEVGLFEAIFQEAQQAPQACAIGPEKVAVDSGEKNLQADEDQTGKDPANFSAWVWPLPALAVPMPASPRAPSMAQGLEALPLPSPPPVESRSWAEGRPAAPLQHRADYLSADLASAAPSSARPWTEVSTASQAEQAPQGFTAQGLALLEGVPQARRLLQTLEADAAGAEHPLNPRGESSTLDFSAGLDVHRSPAPGASLEAVVPLSDGSDQSHRFQGAMTAPSSSLLARTERPWAVQQLLREVQTAQATQATQMPPPTQIAPTVQPIPTAPQAAQVPQSERIPSAPPMPEVQPVRITATAPASEQLAPSQPAQSAQTTQPAQTDPSVQGGQFTPMEQGAQARQERAALPSEPRVLWASTSHTGPSVSSGQPVQALRSAPAQPNDGARLTDPAQATAGLPAMAHGKTKASHPAQKGDDPSTPREAAVLAQQGPLTHLPAGSAEAAMASAWRAPTDENRSLQGDLPSHALLAPARSTAGHAPDLLAGTTAPGPHEVKVILTQGDHAKVAIDMALSDDQQRAWVTLDGTASAWLHRLEGARDDLRLQLKDLGVALQAGDGSTSGGADLGSRQAYSGGAQDGRGWAWAQGHPQAEAPAIKPPHLNNRRDQIGAIHLRA